jgi:inward rectifier potassium channel
MMQRSWLAFFGLILVLFTLLNLLFATAYWVVPGSVSGSPTHSFEDCFYFSVQTLATIGYGNMAPATRYAHLVVAVEALSGVISTAFITGLTFAKFARPTARVLFSEKIAVGTRDGVPTMCFRMANYRHNTVSEAQLRITLLVTDRTREGEEHRTPIDLKLVRDRSATFILTWTAMHVIDETSPFYGENAIERLRERRAEIYALLTGVDETFGQTIHSRYSYRLDDIVQNARFADVLSVLPDGQRVIDYTRFHELVPLPKPGHGDGAAADGAESGGPTTQAGPGGLPGPGAST